MTVFVIIFMIIASILALASLGYVAADVIIEVVTNNKPKEEPQVVQVVVPTPVVEPEPEPVPEVVESIDAEEADTMITDSVAYKTVIYENGAGHGKQAIVNIGYINEMFSSNEIVTLAVMKAKGMMPKNIGRVKILADGIVDKPLTVKAENYSVQAIKMIELTGGTVIILRD